MTDDEHEHKVNPNNISLDEEDDNYKMSIKIRWLNRVERHSLKKVIFWDSRKCSFFFKFVFSFFSIKNFWIS